MFHKLYNLCVAFADFDRVVNCVWGVSLITTRPPRLS